MQCSFVNYGWKRLYLSAALLEGQGEGNASCHHSEAKGGEIWRLKVSLERKFVRAHMGFWFTFCQNKILSRESRGWLGRSYWIALMQKEGEETAPPESGHGELDERSR